MGQIPIGLQLYTVRDEVQKDYEGTLRKVRQVGYQGIEVGYGSKSAEEINSILAELDMKSISVGASIDQLESDVESVIQFSKEIGCRNIGCFWLAEELRNTKEKYEALAESFNKIGEKVAQAGLRFFYHNHDFEFVKYDGEYALDIILNNTNPEWVYLELDTYWAEFGGQPAVPYMKKHANRIFQIHLKDLEDTPERAFAEIGQGTLDVKGIMELCQEIGVEWVIVEQDVCKRPSLESIQMSYDYLKENGYA